MYSEVIIYRLLVDTQRTIPSQTTSGSSDYQRNEVAYRGERSSDIVSWEQRGANGPRFAQTGFRRHLV